MLQEACCSLQEKGGAFSYLWLFFLFAMKTLILLENLVALLQISYPVGGYVYINTV